MNNMLIDYKEYLFEKLRDDEQASAYLNAALMNQDRKMFWIAVKNVAEARGIDITLIAKEAKLNRVSVHRIFSKKSDPKYSNISPLLNAIGFNLSVQPIKK